MIRQHKIREALKFLKQHNPKYHDIKINEAVLNNIKEDLKQKKPEDKYDHLEDYIERAEKENYPIDDDDIMCEIVKEIPNQTSTENSIYNKLKRMVNWKNTETTHSNIVFKSDQKIIEDGKEISTKLVKIKHVHFAYEKNEILLSMSIIDNENEECEDLKCKLTNFEDNIVELIKVDNSDFKQYFENDDEEELENINDNKKEEKIGQIDFSGTFKLILNNETYESDNELKLNQIGLDNQLSLLQFENLVIILQKESDDPKSSNKNLCIMKKHLGKKTLEGLCLNPNNLTRKTFLRSTGEDTVYMCGVADNSIIKSQTDIEKFLIKTEILKLKDESENDNTTAFISGLNKTGNTTDIQIKEINKILGLKDAEFKDQIKVEVKDKVKFIERDYSKPINEYTEPYLLSACFPWLFPYGTGDFTYKGRRKTVNEAEAMKFLMEWGFYDEEGKLVTPFASDPRFGFYIYNRKVRHH